MPVYLNSIATVLPDAAYPQQMIGEVLSAGIDDRKLARLSNRIYSNSGIEKRHSVIRDRQEPVQGGLFFDPDGTFKTPSTRERNEIYTEEAKKLYVCAARKALSEAELAPEEVTHVITVSCTGFFAPGPDYFIVRKLGLDVSTGRYHIGFMGCYAAFPALKMARAFCEADPDAVALIVSLELCTLHLQPPRDIDSLIATSVFADGGAAAVVSSREPVRSQGLRLEGLSTTLTPEGEADMAWTIGDTGFNMVLSTYVPQLLEANIASAVAPLLTNTSKEAIDHWAVHPGGRAILDKVESGLDIDAKKLESSRKILRECGNMSSATVLFVLKDILEKASRDNTVFALAFGPGLTVESGLFTKV